MDIHTKVTSLVFAIDAVKLAKSLEVMVMAFKALDVELEHKNIRI